MAYNFSNIFKNLKAPIKYNTNNKYTNATGPNGLMTGEEVTGNFDTLATASLDLHERLSIVEGFPVSSDSSNNGFVIYNGFKEGEGVFYGGSPLRIDGTSSLSFPQTISAEEYFSVCGNGGIRYLPNGSIDYDNSIFYTIKSGTGTINSFSDLLNLLNGKLINNGDGFYFTGSVDLTSIGDWTSRFSWGSTPASFYVYIDDHPTGVKVNLTTTVNPPGGQDPQGLTGLRNVIDYAFGAAGIGDKIEPEIYDGKYMRFSGNNNRSVGCSRIKLAKDPNSTSDVLYLLGILGYSENTKSIFDFSTTLQFVEKSTNTIQLKGINEYEKLILKDNEKGVNTNSLLYRIKLPIPPNAYSVFYHTQPPKSTYVSKLNFGGILKVNKVYANNKYAVKGTYSNGSTFQIPAGYKVVGYYVKRLSADSFSVKLTMSGIDATSSVTLTSNSVYYSLPILLNYFPSNTTVTVSFTGGTNPSVELIVDLEEVSLI